MYILINIYTIKYLMQICYITHLIFSIYICTQMTDTTIMKIQEKQADFSVYN